MKFSLLVGFAQINSQKIFNLLNLRKIIKAKIGKFNNLISINWIRVMRNNN